MSNNCPNCGAPWDYGAVCEYCGTPNPDIMRVIRGKPVKMTYEAGGKEYTFTLLMNSMSFSYRMDYGNVYDWCGDVVKSVSKCSGADVSIDGTIIPNSNGVHMMERKLDG